MIEMYNLIYDDYYRLSRILIVYTVIYNMIVDYDYDYDYVFNIIIFKLDYGCHITHSLSMDAIVQRLGTIILAIMGANQVLLVCLREILSEEE